jgi:predicted small secreted protein
MMKLLVRAVLPLVAGAFLLAGCTSTQAGTASPVKSDTAAPSSENPSSADPGSASTTALEPCTLLTAADVSGYASSFEPAEEKKLGGARICRFQHKTASATEEGMILSVAIRDSAPLGSVNDTGNGVKDLPVNGRPAKEASSDAPLGCTVALGVGDKSRVDVNATGLNTVAKACQIAEDMATKIVEPKLPKG